MCSCVEDIPVHGTFAEVKGHFRVPFFTMPCFPPIIRDKDSHWPGTSPGGLKRASQPVSFQGST